MAHIGINATSQHAACGMAGDATIAAAPGALPALPAIPVGFGAGFGAAFAMQMGAPERFVSSMQGGVVLDKQGAPAGRVPEGAFVDMQDGKIYGPDSKPLAIQEGSTIDFFDLPSIEDLQKEFTSMTEAYKESSAQGGGTTVGDKSSAPGKDATMKTAVDGQWGPGGVTDLKGGAAGTDAACGMDHGTTTRPAAKGGGQAGTLVGGASGAAAPAGLAAIMQSLQTAMTQITSLTTGIPNSVAGASGGGASDAVSGTDKLGTIPTLQSSLDELIATLKELVDVIRTSQLTGGGAPDKGTTTGPVDKTSTSTDDTSTSTSTETSTT